MHSDEFAARARLDPKAFTRERALPLPALVAMLLNLRKGTLRDELDQFANLLSDGRQFQGVTASALCQARRKLDPLAVLALSERAVRDFYRRFAARRWHGWRLLGVDGSTLRLPATADVIAEFGPPPSGSTIPLARLSRLYDVLNGIVVDADIVGTSVSERVLAGEHLAATDAQDLLLYDRGYPAFWLFALHELEQRAFCMRMPLGFSKEVAAFVASGVASAVVTLTSRGEARRQCEDYGLPSTPLRIRLVRVVLKSGEIEVLATSLLDEARWPTHHFKALYHLRWGIEENYKREQCRLEIENFSGRSAQVVRQDLYAKLVALNLTAMLAWVAQAVADRLYQARRRAYRVNFANALSKMKHTLVRLLLAAPGTGFLTALIIAMATCVEAVRPDRTAPRKVKPAKIQGFHPNYKRCR